MWLDQGSNAPVAKRRVERVGLEMMVRCRRGVTRTTVMLKDLTPYGARIEGLEKMPIGETISLMLPGLQPKLAFVMWSEAMASGLEFEHPLHEDVFSSVVSDFAVGHYRAAAKSAAPHRPVRHAA
jgi:hypothetical protein